MDFDFIPFDLTRMFIGDASLLFLVEIVVRVLIVYIYTVLLLRIVGNSGMKDMNFLDYFIVISLGSASGDVMLYPTVPIIYSLVAVTAMVLLKKLLSYRNVKSKAINEAVQADPVRVVEKGEILHDALQANNIRKDTFMALLRIEGIEHTSNIKVCYIEPNGSLSIFTSDDNFDGESTLPPQDYTTGSANGSIIKRIKKKL